MRDLIIEKLENMEDLKDRSVLKKIVGSFFEELTNYQERSNLMLEKRVFEEFEDLEKNYDIYTTLVKKESINSLDEFMFPIFKEDYYEKLYDKEEVEKIVLKREECYVSTIFMQMDFLALKKILDSERLFDGIIETKDINYKIKVKLVQNRDYFEVNEKINRYFRENGVAWRTLNFPYLRKFVDVIIVEYDELFNEFLDDKDKSLEIEEIRFDIEELEDSKKVDLIPVWNIKRERHKSDGFPLPVEDKINFEHIISMKKMEKEHGYLVTGVDANIVGVNRKNSDLIITTDKNRSTFWEVIKIVQSGEIGANKKEFKIFSNSRNNKFLNKFMQRQSTVIRSLAEINRIVNSFESGKEFNLNRVEIIEDTKNDYHTYDLNSFIKDEIREMEEKKVMLLKFTSKNYTYITYDLLSFIVSELQIYFPEYICKGEIGE